MWLQFGSEEFQTEFKDIIQQEQIVRPHKMVAPHLLRRYKKDVLERMPPKRELILRVELSSKQKDYYKSILTRNFEILTRQGGPESSLVNVVMELHKLCCHAYMLDGVQPVIEDANEAYRQLLDASGKMQLLDKMMVKLKDQGRRVLVYSQFQHMLDILEDYCSSKKWHYERIDGKVSGAERQIRIDRFNDESSPRFCVLLYTRAGGMGINLAMADTIIIYDSDWNPHADLQAIARAHRLGQTNTVMIYRLISRGTIEERMMQLTRKKMVLEHLVVGRLESQNFNQGELHELLRYGSKELFSDEVDEGGKSRQVHYDDDAIDRLLDREQAGKGEATVDDEEGDGFFEAFKVANFGYIDEVKAAAEAEAQKASIANQNTIGNSDTRVYWEELLKDKIEVPAVKESTALGKRRTNPTLMMFVERDDLAGFDDTSSGSEDDDSEAEMFSSGTTSGRKPHSKKRTGGDSNEPLLLMEGDEKSLKVLGFNQRQRAIFVQTLMSFGVGDYDWHKFVPYLKRKSFEEINEYGMLFLTHIAEDITESPYFSDGVPKEGLPIEDVLVRIAQLLLIQEKVKFLQQQPGFPLFSEEIHLRYPGLKDRRSWKEEHDVLLLSAILKHGYGKWQDIVEDKDLIIQQIISQEKNLPCENISSSYSSRMNQKKMVEFIKKRVLLLEKGLNAELQKSNADSEQSVTANMEPGVVGVDIPTSVESDVKPDKDNNSKFVEPEVEIADAVPNKDIDLNSAPKLAD